MIEGRESTGTLARLRLAAMNASDYARDIVAHPDDTDRVPGEFIILARRLRLLDSLVLDAAVALERSHGMNWDQIALAAGLTDDTPAVRWAENRWGDADTDDDMVGDLSDFARETQAWVDAPVRPGPGKRRCGR